MKRIPILEKPLLTSKYEKVIIECLTFGVAGIETTSTSGSQS
jgi:hypothetical protein